MSSFVKRILAVVILMCVAGMFYTTRVSALSLNTNYGGNLVGTVNRRIDEFSQIDSLYYDPSECTSTYSAWNGDEITWDDLNKIGDGDTGAAVKLLASTYGELAMALQEEYGIPWELVFIQMGNESGAGVNRSRSVAIAIRDKDGSYNLLGMDDPQNGKNKYTNGKVYPYTDGYNGSSHVAAEYDSISAMIIGYAIAYFRNGVYDEALQYWGYRNFDFWTGFQRAMCHYIGTEGSCSSSYSDPDGAGGWFYKKVAEVAKEKGWPSSEELAKQKQIEPGGKWAIDGDARLKIWDAYGAAGLPNSSSAVTVRNSDGSSTGNVIADKAKELAWPPGDSHAGRYQGTEAYDKAAKALGNRFVDGCEIDRGTGMCYSCARFVSLTIYESGGDPDFINGVKGKGNNPYMIGTGPKDLTYYLANSDKWERVKEYDGVGYDKLQAGDILIWDKRFHFEYLNNKVPAPFDYHTFIYIGEGKVAEASNSDYAPYVHEWNNAGNNGYIAFRLKNSGTGKGYCSDNQYFGNFDNTIIKYTWPKFDFTRKDAKPDYTELVKSNKYYNGGGATDCNGYVTKMIIVSGIDPNYNSEHGTCRTTLSNIQGSGWGANWEMIYKPGDIIDSSNLKKGDVFLREGHTFLFIGDIDGFECEVASASLGDHVPVACNSGGEKRIGAAYYSGKDYYVFRRK